VAGVTVNDSGTYRVNPVISKDWLRDEGVAVNDRVHILIEAILLSETVLVPLTELAMI
jgi:hypothetical protein